MNDHLNEAAIASIADGEDAAPQHVRDCARCANALAAATQLKHTVRRAVPVVALPEGLRQRVEGRGERKSWPYALAAAAVIAIVLTGATFQSRRSAGRELVDLHSTIVGSANPIDVVSTDKHTVKPWFEGKVPFAVDVPDLAGTPLHLAGGRVVFWRGEPGAYMLVTKGAHRISLFVFRADAVPSFAPPSSMTIESWRTNGLEYIAVGDVPRSDLTALHPSRRD